MEIQVTEGKRGSRGDGQASLRKDQEWERRKSTSSSVAHVRHARPALPTADGRGLVAKRAPSPRDGDQRSGLVFLVFWVSRLGRPAHSGNPSFMAAASQRIGNTIRRNAPSRSWHHPGSQPTPFLFRDCESTTYEGSPTHPGGAGDGVQDTSKG